MAGRSGSKPRQRANRLPMESSRITRSAALQSSLIYARAARSVFENTIRVTAGGGASVNDASRSSSWQSCSELTVIVMIERHTSPKRMTVPVLIDQISRRNFSQSSEPLRAVRPHPDEISCRDRIPFLTQPVDSSPFEHEETVLYDMNFNHWKRCARLVRHCVHSAVKGHIVGKEMPYGNRLVSFQRLRCH